MTGSGAKAAQPSPSTVRKVALAAMTGSAIEWYDFFIYLTSVSLVTETYADEMTREQSKEEDGGTRHVAAPGVPLPAIR